MSCPTCTEYDEEETDDSLEVRLQPSLSALRKLAEHAEAFAQRCQLPAKTINTMLLVLEETVTNVLMHGFEGISEANREVSIQFRKTPRALRLTILDNGAPFDPTHAPPEVSSADSEERVGGWGIKLIRSLMDEVHHDRVGNRNRLELVVYTTAPKPD